MKRKAWLLALAIMTTALVAAAAAESAPRQFLNGRHVVLDGEGKLLPWVSADPAIAYNAIIELDAEFLRHDVQLEHGYPMYYCRPVYLRAEPHGPTDWFSNPADVCCGLIHSFVADDHAFTGNDDIAQEVMAFADYMIASGSTPADPGWAWPSCPYSGDFGGVLPPRGSDQGGSIMCHLVGKLGRGYVWLYKYSEQPHYLVAAVACADALAANVRTGSAAESPWPWRVLPETGTVFLGEEYTANVIDPITLFDELITLGYTGGGSYSAARAAAWNWLMSPDGPIATHNWANYFEDVPYGLDNDCQINVGECARYLLEHTDLDPNWQTHAQSLIEEMETVFGQLQYGAWTMNEQIYFFYPMISHTARYASVCALYYELTGDPVYRDKAFRAFNWSTYGSCPEKARVFIEILDTDYGWFSDCQADFPQHLFSGMASVPEWAPRHQNHLLRSSSIVQSIDYGPTGVTYQTFDAAAREVLRLAARPSYVNENGVPLPERADLLAPGWTWTPLDAGGVCRIRHDTGRQIEIGAREVPAAGPAALMLMACGLGALMAAGRRRR